MIKYRVLVDIDYDPTGKHYESGKEYALDDWKEKHIQSAIQARLIRKEGKEDGRSSRSP